MASLPTCAPASPPVQSLHRPSAGGHAPCRAFITTNRRNFLSHLNLRLKNEATIQVVNNRFSPVYASSNANPSQESDNKKASEAAPSPPFLTILAGALVFLFICWIIRSIVTLLIGLIVHSPPN